MSRAPEEQITHFLSDLYSMELQAIAQLEKAPDLAGDPGLAADIRQHCIETERQAELVRARLEALGGSTSAIKDAIMKLGGKGFLLFAKMQLETPGRLTAHSYSYEAMEWAGYEMLIRMAEMAGDDATAELGRSIQTEEREMMRRLERHFDAAEAFSHSDMDAEKLAEHVKKHLAEAHALEEQSVALLEKSADISDDSGLDEIYARHLEESRAISALVEKRLEALGGKRSLFQDAALKLGGLNWGLFFQSQTDTPAKLAAFVYAVHYLKIGGHELLLRTARRAQDLDTEQMCARIIAEERAMAEELADEWMQLSAQATFQAAAR